MQIYYTASQQEMTFKFPPSIPPSNIPTIISSFTLIRISMNHTISVNLSSHARRRVRSLCPQRDFCRNDLVVPIMEFLIQVIVE